jgi:peptidyl-prolyl cis-trans isomerase C
MKKFSLSNSLNHLVTIFFFASFVCVTVTATSHADSSDAVVATVNDTPIRMSQLEPAIQSFKQKTKKTTVTQDEQIELLKGIIRRQLILEQKETDALRKDETVQRMVKEYEDQLVVNRYVYEKVGKHVTVDEKETREYYRSNIRKFTGPPKVKTRHILLKSEEEARAILKKLEQGEDFQELARKYSIDLPTARDGGLIGVLEKGRTLPELEQVVFLMAEGEHSDVVQSSYGYHILTVDEILTVQYQPYEDVREQLKSVVKNEKEAKAFDLMAAELEKDADIKFFKEKLVSSDP